MYSEAPHSYLTGVPGWETVSEQAALVNLAKAVPVDGVIVEIGAEFGMSASLFAYAADPSVEIWSVDLFPGDMLTHHLENLAEAGYAERTPAGWVSRTNQLKGDSAEIGKRWAALVNTRNGTGIDLLFIDGDHSYRGVIADLNVWFPFVRAGGKVAFHDVAQPSNPTPHEQHYEVAAALRDFMKDHPDRLNIVERVDSLCVAEVLR